MNRVSTAGVVHYRFEGLDRADGVIHAVLTRHGGVSPEPFATLNLGHTVGDSLKAVDENHRRALDALGLDGADIVSPYQVHSARVGMVGRGHRGSVQPATDALVTEASGVPLLLRFADCAPVVFHDPVRRVVGLAHAGWRGVAAGIVDATVTTMRERWGSNPGDLWAGVGPTIGACCYTVGPDVATAVESACPSGVQMVREVEGQLFLDMPTAIRSQLRHAGVEQIEDAGLCTACHVDEFFSFRKENGRTGRFGAVIGLVA